ncbi:hypothetical protein G6F57_023580 [Rhizopus arrhizus]|nr:hypothetical protein G6F57_023580 [Rhizopus arrhizus]
MLDQPKVSLLTPSNDHGDTDDRPRPTPRISRMRDSAAAATAPAKIAPQDTALSLAGGTMGAVTTVATSGPSGPRSGGSNRVLIGMDAPFQGLRMQMAS